MDGCDRVRLRRPGNSRIKGRWRGGEDGARRAQVDTLPTPEKGVTEYRLWAATTFSATTDLGGLRPAEQVVGAGFALREGRRELR